jgi:hypothetical protein
VATWILALFVVVASALVVLLVVVVVAVAAPACCGLGAMLVAVRKSWERMTCLGV